MQGTRQKITTFFMFTGQAEEAMNFYTSLFEDSDIIQIIHQENGSVMHATFTLKGQTYMCIDSAPIHDFTFTPAISMFVNCDSEEEVQNLYEHLSEGGSILMPLGETALSAKFCWIQDKYGVSWQLNLPQKDVAVK
jgi:predicted 3-demethylubiquinone-9 3-methyltransferase (glyoxalase superfamily)